MIKVKIAQLKDRLSEHLRAVEKGAEVIVTDRDRPIARIVPIDKPRRHIRVVSPKSDFSVARRKRYPSAGWKLSSTELLLEERQQR